MSAHNETKIKHLIDIWPMHTVAPSHWLEAHGYSRFLVRRYVESGWVKRFGHGAIVRSGDTVNWKGAVWGAQQNCKVHVGGKTALELQGKSHFVKFKDTHLFLFSKRGLKLPRWIRVNNQNWDFIHTSTTLFPNAVGLLEVDCGEFSIHASNPARAFCEYLYLVEKYHTYDEAWYLMENLGFLDAQLMQEALEKCTSIKVKRLVLCLAKLQDVAWYKKLNLNKIALGHGKRQGVKNGIYDPEFRITYPRKWKDEEIESPF